MVRQHRSRISLPSASSSKHLKPVSSAKKRKAREDDEDDFFDEDARSSDASASDERDEDVTGERQDESEIGSENDADKPRFAQWVDDDDEQHFSGFGDAESEESGAESGGEAEGEGRGRKFERSAKARKGKETSYLKTIEEGLSTLPLGALRKAQRMVVEAEADSEESDDSEGDSESDDAGVHDEDGRSRRKSLEGEQKGKEGAKKIAKRANKHAPVEITARKPVTRKRTVVETKTIQPRDPRFLPMTGEFSAEKFQNNYGFLTDAHQNELKTLKENLKRARRMLASSPRDQREEREREVKRLELAVKRAESLVDRDKQEKTKLEALNKFKADEKKKRNEGKGKWWLKKSQEKEIVMRAKYDAIAADGGKLAVKKAIEKKQKKIAQKEKKQRPFRETPTAKRPSERPQGGRPKRPKLG